jgi:hypothetical protein
MKRILLIALCLVCIVGTVSAYGLYISCPESVQVGQPLKCSIDSDEPAGYTFDLVLYQSQYTATEISRQSVTIQSTKNTQYKLFDTQGLPASTYKVEVQFKTTSGDSSLRSDSVTAQLVKLIDRSGEITITAPLTQNLADALRIEGSIDKLGADGVEIEVRGPDGKIFGPQWVGTKKDVKNGAGIFTQKVYVTGPGAYEVTFTDAKGYIGVITFQVSSPVTTVLTTVPVTTVKTTKVPTTVPPTTLPTPTQSPLSSLAVTGGLLGATLLAGTIAKRRE